MNSNKIHYAWFVLIACIGFYAIPVGVVGNTSGIFIKPVMQDMGWSQTTTTLYMTIQPWVAALCTPVAGKILTKYSPRIVLTLSVLAYGLGTIWTSFAKNPWEWHVYGVIYGISCAFFMFLAVPTLINAWFEKKAGLAIGISGAALSITAAICSPVGQSIIENSGWRTARLWFGIIITIIPTILTFLFVRKDPMSMGLKPFGAAEKGGTAENITPEAELQSKGATVAQARGSIALYLLILVAGFFVLCAAFFQQIPNYASNTALGAGAGAVAVSIIMVGGTVGKFLLGWMCDQFGSKITGVFAALCGAAGLGLAFFAGSSQVMFYIGMGIYGVGYSALTVISPMLAREGFGTANYSEIYSWVSTGIFVFSGAAALIFAQIKDHMGSLDPAFYLVIALYVVSAIFIPIISSTAKKSWQKVS